MQYYHNTFEFSCFFENSTACVKHKLKTIVAIQFELRTKSSNPVKPVDPDNWDSGGRFWQQKKCQENLLEKKFQVFF